MELRPPKSHKAPSFGVRASTSQAKERKPQNLHFMQSTKQKKKKAINPMFQTIPFNEQKKGNDI